MRIRVVHADTYDYGILACVFIDIALKIVGFDSAARAEVLGIEVKHYPLALELTKRHLHPFLGNRSYWGNRSDDLVRGGECCRCVPPLSASNEPTLSGCFLRFASVPVGTVPQRDVLLIALGREAQSAIKELVQQAQQLHLAVNFDSAEH
jgi:hypothetical protein